MGLAPVSRLLALGLHRVLPRACLADAVTYFVRSPDGTDYRVGVWDGGVWRPGDRCMAIRELHALAEPGAYVWGRSG